VIDTLLKIARGSQCTDVTACQVALENAAENQRSLVRSVLDSKLVDETQFLQGISDWLQIPWWDKELTSVPGQLREKVPAR